MTNLHRGVISSLGLAVVLMAGSVGAAPAKRRPQQVVPTGAEDAPSEARTAAASLADVAKAEAELDRMTSKSSEGLTKIRRDDGTVGVDLDGRFLNVIRVTTNADGTVSATCSDAKPAAPQKVRAPKKAPEGVAKTQPAPAQAPALEEM